MVFTGGARVLFKLFFLACISGEFCAKCACLSELVFVPGLSVRCGALGKFSLLSLPLFLITGFLMFVCSNGDFHIGYPSARSKPFAPISLLLQTKKLDFMYNINAKS